MPALRRAMAYLRPYWRVSLGAFLSLLIVTATSLISPQILRYAIDSGIAGCNPQTLLWACLGLVGVAALRNLFTFTQTYWIEQAGQGVAFTMRNALVKQLNALSFSYHDQAQTGQLMTRVTNDVDTARQFISGGLIQLLNALLLLVGSAAILLAI